MKDSSMSASSIVENYAAECNWDDDSVITILCEYIDNQGSWEAFLDFVALKASEDRYEEET